jgi:hypothetical protein
MQIYSAIFSKVINMGLEDQWSGFGAPTYEAASGDKAEGDSSGGPTFQRAEPHDWPTLVIESGFSQSLQALRNQMRWWFSASDHQVKIVIIAKLFASERRIIIEKYQEVQAAQRTGATSTRAARRLEPRLDQSIYITQAPSGDPMDPTSYIVTRGVLRLEFHLLFLRQPATGEQDVIIEIPRLQMIAVKVWGRSAGG